MCRAYATAPGRAAAGAVRTVSRTGVRVRFAEAHDWAFSVHRPWGRHACPRRSSVARSRHRRCWRRGAHGDRPSPQSDAAPRRWPRPGRRAAGAPGAARAHVPAGHLLQLPQRGQARQGAIRNRVLRHDPEHLGRAALTATACRCRATAPIRIATWSFKDRTIAQALVAARERGVSVQVMAARAPTRRPGVAWLSRARRRSTARAAGTLDRSSFARECRAPAAVAAARRTRSTSCSPTSARPRAQHRDPDLDEPDRLACQGQWNQAPATRPDVYDRFMAIFREARLDAPSPRLPRYRRRRRGHVLPATAPARRARPGDAALNRSVHRRRRDAGHRTGSGSSSTPSTTTAASGSPRGCASCGTPAATSRSSTR